MVWGFEKRFDVAFSALFSCFFRCPLTVYNSFDVLEHKKKSSLIWFIYYTPKWTRSRQNRYLMFVFFFDKLLWYFRLKRFVKRETSTGWVVLIFLHFKSSELSTCSVWHNKLSRNLVTKLQNILIGNSRPKNPISELWNSAWSHRYSCCAYHKPLWLLNDEKHTALLSLPTIVTSQRGNDDNFFFLLKDISSTWMEFNYVESEERKETKRNVVACKKQTNSWNSN